jgi:hypothetical protein
MNTYEQTVQPVPGTIECNVALLGPLTGSGAAIVQLIRDLSPECRFTFSWVSGEWTVYPDNWINLDLTHERKYRIHLSLGVPPGEIRDTAFRLGLDVRPGRYHNWAKTTISDPSQTAPILELLRVVFREADNGYRSGQRAAYLPAARARIA